MARCFSRMLQIACLVILTAAVATCLPPVAGAGQQSPRTLKADLDGDGVAETITLAILTASNGDTSFSLTVGAATVKHKSEYGDDIAMQVIDVDRGDKLKEVMVTAVGGSDFTQTLIYRYDGKALVELAAFDNQGGIEFNGNGIALQSNWMGFWTCKRKYQLDRATQRFREVPQEIYYVGVEGKVKETFPVYERRNTPAVVANTRAGSTMLVVACDPSPRCPGDTNDACHWYLIKTESGLLGWVRLETLRDKADLPWAG